MNEKTLFFKELQIIQDTTINIIISQKDEFNDIEEMLIEATFDVIYRCMELLDGYGLNGTKYAINNLDINKCINKEMNLHDLCEEYLKHTNI